MICGRGTFTTSITMPTLHDGKWRCAYRIRMAHTCCEHVRQQTTHTKRVTLRYQDLICNRSTAHRNNHRGILLLLHPPPPASPARSSSHRKSSFYYALSQLSFPMREHNTQATSRYLFALMSRAKRTLRNCANRSLRWLRAAHDVAFKTHSKPVEEEGTTPAHMPTFPSHQPSSVSDPSSNL